MSSSYFSRMGFLSHLSFQRSFPAVKEFRISSPQNLAVFNRRVLPRRCMYPRNQLSMEKTGVAVTDPEKIEIFRSLEEWAKTDVLVHLKSVEKSWQPQDFLPDPSSEGFFDQVHEIRARSMEIPDDYYVCLVGDLITEEALPTYESMLNRMDGVKDETGASPCSWAIWTRNWTAEENRHGDLLNKYLYLCGRVDMRQVEKTIQYLISCGLDVGAEQNPYLCFVYTSFQERATFISHGNTAKHAKDYGDPILAKICGTIASDEKRHETAYTKIVEKLFEIDPDTMMQAFACMMKRKITMPGVLMFDGQDENLFDNFSSVAQRMGVYTAKDYVDNLEFFLNRWKADKIMVGLSGEGRQAQDYVCNLPTRMKKLAERIAKSKTNQSSTARFSWIFDREVMI